MSTTKTLLETGNLGAIGAALQAGDVSARELAEHCLAAAAASDINAFVDVQPELTLAQADEADTRLAAARQSDERASPLLGVPMAHKDVFVTRGWKSTAGSKMLADYQSPFDAPSCARCARPVPSASASSTATNSPWGRATRTRSSAR